MIIDEISGSTQIRAFELGAEREVDRRSVFLSIFEVRPGDVSFGVGAAGSYGPISQSPVVSADSGRLSLTQASQTRYVGTFAFENDAGAEVSGSFNLTQ